MPNDKITAVGANIAEKAAMIWNVADMLRGPFKPHEYGLVILPMTVVKRFHDCLLPTHQAVLDTYEKVKKLQVIDGFQPVKRDTDHLQTVMSTVEEAGDVMYLSQNVVETFIDRIEVFNDEHVKIHFTFENVLADYLHILQSRQTNLPASQCNRGAASVGSQCCYFHPCCLFSNLRLPMISGDRLQFYHSF